MQTDSSSEGPSANDPFTRNTHHYPPHLNLSAWGSAPASPSTSSFNPPTSASSGPHKRRGNTIDLDCDRMDDSDLNLPPIPTSSKEKQRVEDGESRFNTATTTTRVNGHSRTGTGTTVTDIPKTPQTGSSFDVLRRATTSLLTPDRRIGPAPTTWQSLKSILFASWLNVLLVFIPVSWALHFALPASTRKDTIVFITSFLAIIPLAKLLAFATDDLSIRVGQTLAGLMNATLGNAVELIISIIALIKCELRIVQASLVGSILSNLLLVLGMCFFAGGLKFSEQGFGVGATQLNSSLLTISVIAILLPAAFHFALGPGTATDPSPVVSPDILDVSHGVAVILLIIYIAYLWFQLVSHTTLYDDDGEHVMKTTRYAHGTRKFGLPPKQPKKVKNDLEAPGPYSSEMNGNGRPASYASGTIVNDGTVASRVMMMTTTAAASAEPRLDTAYANKEGNHVAFMADPVTGSGSQADHSEEEDEEETPQMSLVMCIMLLVAVTVLVALTAEWLVGSINGLTESGTVGKEFVGIILLPIAGNAAEHATAVTVSVKDKLNLSIGVAVGSSIQIALFVIPFIVILGWILGKPLSMLFDPYESIAMFLAVLTVNYVVQDGKSNWLEGFILMMLYVILAVTFWFYGGAPGFDQFSC